MQTESSSHTTTIHDILLFVSYLVAHPKECLEAGCTNKTIYTEILPELVVWVGSMMDQHANCLTKGKGALVELPLLRTQGGNLKRKADQVNKLSCLRSSRATARTERE